MPEGATATLTVQASSPDGSALSYRWLRNGSHDPSAGTSASATVPMRGFNTSYPSETWQVELSNASGAVHSATTAVNRVNRQWQDLGIAHPGQGAPLYGPEGPAVSMLDPNGRVHLLSSHMDASYNTVIAFKGHSKDSAADGWAYSSVLPAGALNVSISHISISSSYEGGMVAAWVETWSQAGVRRSQVRAALYQPGASAAVPGSWVSIGNVSDTESLAYQPTVITIGAGAFGIAFLQQSSLGQPRDAVMRRYIVPAAGSAAESGLLEPSAMESVAADISRLQVLGTGGLPMAMMFVEAAGGVAARWQHSFSRNGQWPALADLAVSGPAERIHWAAPVNGMTVLATMDGNGRLYTRRVDTVAGTFTDSSWDYRANAYGSAPALLIDADGRIDIFGVSVATASTHHSVIGHWTFTPTSGWSGANLIAQSATDYRQGLGLRAPVAGRDGVGNLLLAWTEQPTSTAPQTLRFKRYSRVSQGWTDAADVAAPAATVATTTQRYPTLKVDDNGRATVAWVEEVDGSDARVKHARLR